MTNFPDRRASLDPTREKLIESAGEVFADFGFHDATVREICSRAGANVAAVNYHFGDKLGLYTEVLKSSMLAQQVSSQKSWFIQTSDGRAALRELIRDWFERISEGGKRAWLSRIMAHEMANPTPALDQMAGAMSANYLRFRAVVGGLIRCSPDDTRTRMCVHSIVGQILHYVQSRPTLARLWPELNLADERQRRAIADHIVEFSVAGMESVARKAGEQSNQNPESGEDSQAVRIAGPAGEAPWSLKPACKAGRAMGGSGR